MSLHSGLSASCSSVHSPNSCSGADGRGLDGGLGAHEEQPLALALGFEHAALDLVEVEDDRALAVEQPDRILRPDAPDADIPQHREIRAGRIEFELEAAGRRVGLEVDGAALVARGVGDFPGADHRLGGLAQRRGRLRARDAGDAQWPRAKRDRRRDRPHACSQHRAHWRLLDVAYHVRSRAGVMPPAAGQARRFRRPWRLRHRRERRLAGGPGHEIVDHELVHLLAGGDRRRAEMRETARRAPSRSAPAGTSGSRR